MGKDMISGIDVFFSIILILIPNKVGEKEKINREWTILYYLDMSIADESKLLMIYL